MQKTMKKNKDEEFLKLMLLLLSVAIASIVLTFLLTWMIYDDPIVTCVYDRSEPAMVTRCYLGDAE
jgi:hypothetical protein